MRHHGFPSSSVTEVCERYLCPFVSQCCYTGVVVALTLLSTGSFRQSYTLRHANIGRLAVLSSWEHRTPSQQVDQLIYQGFVAYRETLDSEQRAALDAEFTEYMEVV
jgi:hypothetical protein